MEEFEKADLSFRVDENIFKTDLFEHDRIKTGSGEPRDSLAEISSNEKIKRLVIVVF